MESLKDAVRNLESIKPPWELAKVPSDQWLQNLTSSLTEIAGYLRGDHSNECTAIGTLLSLRDGIELLRYSVIRNQLSKLKTVMMQAIILSDLENDDHNR